MAERADGHPEDIAVMLAAMSSLLDREYVQNRADRGDPDLAQFGQHRSRQGILADHAKSRQNLNPYGSSTRFAVNTSTTAQNNVKPADGFPHTPSMGDCTPIHVHALNSALGPHRGRLLRGTLAVQPAVMRGVYTVLEDELGDLVRVGFYNALPGVPEDKDSQWNAARRLFSPGRRIAIIEPDYKLASDGTFIVRVDNPREVLCVDTIGPTHADGWRAEGNRHFRALEIKEAQRCYCQSLGLHDSRGLLSALLLNCSACHQALGQHAAALAAAAAAVAVDCTSAKAHFRVAAALDALGFQSEALKRCKEALKHGSSQDITSMLTRLETSACQRDQQVMPQSRIIAKVAKDAALQRTSPHETDAVGEDASEFYKERGDALFRSGQQQAALCEYRTGLRCFAGSALVLSNRAACALEIKYLEMVVRDCCAALVLDATHVKSYLRCAQALLGLQWLVEAQDVVTMGLVAIPHEASLEALQKRITSAQSTATERM